MSSKEEVHKTRISIAPYKSQFWQQQGRKAFICNWLNAWFYFTKWLMMPHGCVMEARHLARYPFYQEMVERS